METQRAFIPVALALLLAACGDGNEGAAAAVGGPYKLTFQGDATFTAVHAGQALKAGLIVKATNELLDVQSTTVASSGDPSFSVTFAPTLEPTVQYHLHYWIDSNFGGGTVGTCDPPQIDHQWALDPPIGQATFKDTHRPSDVSSVCGTF